MCTCAENLRCGCYRDDREYRHERARQAVGSRIEHDVLALLADPAALVASPLAIRLADQIRSRIHARDGNGVTVGDVLVIGGGVFYWVDGDGAQYFTRLDSAAVTLLAA